MAICQLYQPFWRDGGGGTCETLDIIFPRHPDKEMLARSIRHITAFQRGAIAPFSSVSSYSATGGKISASGANVVPKKKRGFVDGVRVRQKHRPPQKRASSLLSILTKENFEKLKNGREWPNLRAGDSIRIEVFDVT